MKNIATIILLAGLSSLLAARAQTNVVPGNPPVGAIPNTNALSGSNIPAAVVLSPAPAPATATNETPAAIGTNAAPASTSPASPTVATAADTNSPAATGGPVIPLIHFSDVPITTAIESLARQAGINYMLDPKIGYGQPDQSGQIKTEPQLSIRWEAITPESALMALLDNYGLQLLRDKKTSIARITLKDPLAPPPLITRVVQLKFASTSNMVDAVQSVLSDKRSRVIPDTRTSQIVVSATDPEQVAVDTLIAQLDKPTKQVLIEARFVEVQSNPSTSKGIDWSGTLAGQNVSFGNGVTGTKAGSTGGSSSAISGSTSTLNGTPVTTTTTTPGGAVVSTTTSPSSTPQTSLNSVIQGSSSPGGLSWNTLSGLTPAIGFLNADGVQAVISFLNTSKDAQTVSTPRVVTLDNQKATLSVSRGIPVINVTAGTVQNAGGSSVTYSNVGTFLEVTPRISANNFIWLKVVPEISVFAGPDNQTIGGLLYSAPLFDSRKIETQVLIPDGNTLVMGGLVNDSPVSTSTKVPILGDIPYLGYAFRSESKSLNKDNLIIFITPTIVQDTDFRPNPTDFLQATPNSAGFKSPVHFDSESAWDTTKTRDWSNPFSHKAPDKQ